MNVHPVRALAPILLVSVLSMPLSAGSHCIVHYAEDFESGPAWIPSNTGFNQWVYVDETVTPQPFGYNAYTRTHFWYVGNPHTVLPGMGYLSGDDGSFSLPSTLTSPPINLGSAVDPELIAYIAGGSELGFDFLKVYVDDGMTRTLVAALSGERSYGPPLQIPLTAYAGKTITVVYEFFTDLTIEDGPGWNADDVIIRDC